MRKNWARLAALTLLLALLPAMALAAEYAGNGAAPAVAATVSRPKSAGAMERSRKQSREAVQPR